MPNYAKSYKKKLSSHSSESSNECQTIFYGKRDESFKSLIRNILVNSKLKQKYIDVILNEENLKLYGHAFTTSRVDPDNNYEFYEQLGDVTLNKFLVSYAYKRFPKLRCTLGVKVVARIKINYGKTQTCSNIAKSLGFWDYISAYEDERASFQKNLLEDVFEAFIGVTESILDNIFNIGVGYNLLYSVLQSLYDKINISLKYEDLFDNVTRLKELFDKYWDKLSNLKYTIVRKDNESPDKDKSKNENKNESIGKIRTKNIKICNVTCNINGVLTCLSTHTDVCGDIAKQKAALQAIYYLNDHGFTTNIHSFYGEIDPINNKRNLRKTKMCLHIIQGKECPYKDRCNFAHSESELIKVKFN